MVFLVSVVVRVRGWMVQRRVPGCSYVKAHMFISHKIPTIWTIYDKNTNAFFTKETFDIPQSAPNSSEKQHRKKLWTYAIPKNRIGQEVPKNT